MPSLLHPCIPCRSLPRTPCHLGFTGRPFTPSLLGSRASEKQHSVGRFLVAGRVSPPGRWPPALGPQLRPALGLRGKHAAGTAVRVYHGSGMWIERELRRLLSSWIASRGGDCDLEAFLLKARCLGMLLEKGCSGSTGLTLFGHGRSQERHRECMFELASTIILPLILRKYIGSAAPDTLKTKRTRRGAEACGLDYTGRGGNEAGRDWRMCCKQGAAEGRRTATTSPIQ